MNFIHLPTVAFICCLMSFLISVFYLIFWKSQRSKTIAGVCGFFAISYACYGFRLVCQLLASQGLTFLDRLNDIFYVGWVFALWLGVRIYGGTRTFHPALGVVPLLLIIWDLIAGGAGIALPWHALPENIAGTVWFGMAGLTLWRLYRDRRNRGLAALAILLWVHGISTASYPMTRATWYAPYGFTIFFLLSLAIGMGMMLVALFEEKQKLLTEMDSRRLAEEALHRQNRLIETFFSQAVTPFFLMDRDYNYIRVNGAWAKNFKMNIEDFPGSSYLMSYPDKETIASDARQILDEVVRSGRPFQASARPFEFPNQPERGITYWDLILQPIFKEDGELDFLFFTSLDVTEHKKAEDELSRYREHLEELVKERTVELRASEAKYRSLVRKVQTAIVLYDSQGRILDSNPLAHHLLGLSADQLLGKSLIDPQWHFLREDGSVLPVAEYPANRVLSTRQPLRDYVTGIRRPDRDEVAWVLVNAEPEYDNAGQIAQVVVSFVDISERKRAEQELKQMNERFTLATTAARLGVWDWDIQKNEMVWDDGMYALYGVKKDEFSDTYEIWWNGVHPDDRALGNEISELTRRGDRQYDTEFRVVWPDGSIHYLKAYGQVVRDAHGLPLRMTGINYDITANKQAQEALYRLNRELRAISSCNQVLVRAEDEQRLINDICRIICEEAGYRMAWVGYAENDKAKSVHPAAWAGSEDGYLAGADITWADTQRGRGPTGTAIRSGESTCIQDFKTDPQAAPWRENALQRGYRSSIALPLKDESARTFGVLNIYSTEPNAFKPDEIRLLEDLAGDLAFGIIILRARAERKQMEQELILREREYRTLLESVPDYIVRYNSDLQRIYVNPAWEKASGLSKKEVVGVSHSDIPRVPQPVVDDYAQKLRATMENGASRTAEFTWVNADGVRLYLEYVIVPEYDNQGQIAGVLAVGRDITDRRQAEEKLKVSEERLRMTLETTQIGIWDWDVANDRYYASPIYYAMLGYEPKEGLADRSEWVQRLHPDDQPKVQEEVQKVLSGTCEAYSYEARFRHADGSYRWQWAFGYGAGYDEAGKVVRMLGLRMDIDQRKQMEQELSAYREHLEELVRERTLELEKSQEQIIDLNQDLQSRAIALEAVNKELDAFAYTVSHDLRAPLRHVNGFIELLQKKMEADFDEQSRHYMHVISDSAHKMAQLIDDLLSFSRMGRCALSIQQVDLDALVGEIIEQLEASAAERKIAWNVGDLPLVSGDASMLRIVLANLISNAMKFSRTRQPAHIEIGSLPDQSSETVIYVRDNGAGFDMAYADKLFGVFQRLHRADEFEGTGIGLATVRRIIARHGGRTWAKGQPDQGATFYIALPQQAGKQQNA